MIYNINQYRDQAVLKRYLTQSANDLGMVWKDMKVICTSIPVDKLRADLTTMVEVGNNFLLDGFSKLIDQRFFDDSDNIELRLEESDEAFVIRATEKLSKALNQCGVKNIAYVFEKGDK